MNELLEQRIREIYAEDAARFDPTPAVIRLSALRHPVRTSRRRKLWAAVGASGSALTGGVVAAILVFSSGASVAYAGWSSVPSTPSAQTIAATSATCEQPFKDGETLLRGSSDAEDEVAFTGPPVLAEARGIYVALIEVSDGKLYYCLTHGSAADPTHTFSLDVGAYGTVQSAPAGDQISAPYTPQSAFGKGRGGSPIPSHATAEQLAGITELTAGGGYGPSMLGQVGPDVASVSVTLDNGQTVVATVQNGWYFAWWPWGAQPKSVTVTTASGTTTTGTATRVPYAGVTSPTPTSTSKPHVGPPASG